MKESDARATRCARSSGGVDIAPSVITRAVAAVTGGPRRGEARRGLASLQRTLAFHGGVDDAGEVAAAVADAVRASVADAPPSHLQPAPAPALATSLPRHDAEAPMFRAEALAAHRRGEGAASVLRLTSPARWAVLLALTAAVALGAALTATAEVEETSPARAVLRTALGVQPVVAALSGTVQEVRIEAGARVTAGQGIARLDAAPLRTSLAEADQRLADAEAAEVVSAGALEARRVRGGALLAARGRLLEARARAQERLLALRAGRAAKLADPALEAVIEDEARAASAAAEAAARADLLRIREELSALRLEQSIEATEHPRRLAAERVRVDDARARRDAARALLAETEVRVPIDGRLESLRIVPGQVVHAGDVLARVVRDAPPATSIAFVPEHDAAFLRVGAHATLALDALPEGEFGQLSARVSRVGSELADPAELAATLGDAAPRGPHVRVELSLVRDRAHARLAGLLRPGALATARIALRERRLLAMVLEPARRWLR